ncbi:MAG: hypothetical protein M9899_08465 [Bdellovibrionaceae bacterium]|nr:hypothetical protein [Pseudobdellovibrionaceae bacterium]
MSTHHLSTKVFKKSLILFGVSLIALSQLSHAQNLQRRPQQTDKELCFHFDLKPFQKHFAHSQGIDSLTFYPSLFNSSKKSQTTMYFVDRGVHNDPDAYNNVKCHLSASYISCKGEDDSANLGIFVDPSKAQLHIKFLVLSDLDEELRVLQPLNAKKTPSIPGKVFPCPTDSPEASLY